MYSEQRFNDERDAQQNIIVKEPVGFASGFLESEVAGELRNWNRKQGLPGIVASSSAGYLLPNKAVRSPDASWISRERFRKVSKEAQKKFLPPTPAFIVEIRSQSDSIIELQNKMLEWIEQGALLAWLIDPTEKKTFIFRPEVPAVMLEGFDHKLSGEDVLLNFELDLNLLKFP